VKSACVGILSINEGK